jgi:predicted  nucleic acid-binding Zn-ribbon protein
MKMQKIWKERDDFENKLADLSNEKELLVEQIASKEFEIENLQETIVDLNDKLVNNGF